MKHYTAWRAENQPRSRAGTEAAPLAQVEADGYAHGPALASDGGGDGLEAIEPVQGLERSVVEAWIAGGFREPYVAYAPVGLDHEGDGDDPGFVPLAGIVREPLVASDGPLELREVGPLCVPVRG